MLQNSQLWEPIPAITKRKPPLSGRALERFSGQESYLTDVKFVKSYPISNKLHHWPVYHISKENLNTSRLEVSQTCRQIRHSPHLYTNTRISSNSDEMQKVTNISFTRVQNFGPFPGVCYITKNGITWVCVFMWSIFSLLRQHVENNLPRFFRLKCQT